MHWRHAGLVRALVSGSRSVGANRHWTTDQPKCNAHGRLPRVQNSQEEVTVELASRCTRHYGTAPLKLPLNASLQRLSLHTVIQIYWTVWSLFAIVSARFRGLHADRRQGCGGYGRGKRNWTGTE